MDASVYTHKVRTRAEYMNYVSNQVALDKKCISISNIKSGATDSHDLAVGAKYTSCEDVTCAKINACGRRPLTDGNGSASFPGNSSARMYIPAHPDFALGAGDFTIEWFQYLIPEAAIPRIFSLGSYPVADLSVSMEEDNEIYVWIAGFLLYMGNLVTKNRWVHFALVRYSGALTLYANGQALRPPQPANYDLNNASYDLILGNEQPSLEPERMYFRGFLTNFHWVKGAALYTSNFTPPSTPIQPIADSKLLLDMIANQVTEDTSGTEKVVYAVNVSWSTMSPFLPFAGLEYLYV